MTPPLLHASLAATHLAPAWAIVIGAASIVVAVALDRRLARATLPARSARRRRWTVRVLGAIGVLAAFGLAIVDPHAGTASALVYLGAWSLVLVLVIVAAGLAVLDALFWLGLHAAALRHLERGASSPREDERP